MSENDVEVELLIYQRGYTTQQWINICKAMKKRHAHDVWFYEEMNWDKTSIQYLRAEGVDWIDVVYHRGRKHYLDAEIAFSIKEISKLDQTRLEAFNQKYIDMSVKALIEYFQLSEKRIRNALGIFKITTIENSGHKLKIVKASDVKMLEQKVFKKTYWKRLEEVRLCLEKEKSIH